MAESGIDLEVRRAGEPEGQPRNSMSGRESSVEEQSAVFEDRTDYWPPASGCWLFNAVVAWSWITCNFTRVRPR